jgi:hypothetical protein
MQITKEELEKKIFPMISPPDESLRLFEKYDRLMAVCILKGGPLNNQIISLTNRPWQTYSQGSSRENAALYIPTNNLERDRWVFEWVEVI